MSTFKPLLLIIGIISITSAQTIERISYTAKTIGRPVDLTLLADELVVTFDSIPSDQSLQDLGYAQGMALKGVKRGKKGFVQYFLENKENVHEARSALRANRNVRAVSASYRDSDGVKVKFIPGQILVQFNPGTSRSNNGQLLRDNSAVIIQQHEEPGFYTVEVLDVKDYNATLNALTGSPTTIFAEPNYLVPSCMSSFDPKYADEQWNLNNTGQYGGTIGADINVEAAWQITTGSSDIWIAPLEGSFNQHHDDLDDQYISELGMAYNNGIGVAIDPDVEIVNNHSSKIVGIIAAEKNGTGVQGIAYNSKILPVAVDGSSDYPGGSPTCSTDNSLIGKVNAIVYIKNLASSQ